MSETCDHNCETCGKSCESRDAGKKSFLAPQNPGSNVRKVIAVASGKGGVGKSLVTSLLATAAAKRGLKTAILDADITGPSIPTAFGLSDRIEGEEHQLAPAVSSLGIKVMSLNLLLDDPSSPVIWRGPILAGVVKQFWSDVIWGDIDVMFVDMPPGTGDVPLTVFQSLHVDGVVVATSPQQLVGLVVEKAVNMAEMMQIPVLGFVENMSVFKCPQCGAVHEIYGPGATDALAARHAGRPVCKLPIDPAFARASDSGAIESLDCHELDPLLDAIAKL